MRSSMSEDFAGELIESAQHEELSKLGAEAADIAFDKLIDIGISQGLPVFSFFRKTYTSVRDHLYAKKVYLFLTSLGSMPAAKRRQQISKLVVNTNERQRIGETLLMLLDRMNNFDKPAMLAKAFRAYLEEWIDRQCFDGIANAIDQLHTPLLPKIKALVEAPIGLQRSEVAGKLMRTGDATALAVCGLVHLTVATFGEPGEDAINDASLECFPSALGEQFVNVVLK